MVDNASDWTYTTLMTRYTIHQVPSNDVGGQFTVTYTRPSAHGYTASLKAATLLDAVDEFSSLARTYGWNISDTVFRCANGARVEIAL